MTSLAKRAWLFWDDDGDGSNGWYSWGRWVLLGVIVGVAILSFIFLQVTSCRRARHGQRPLTGTAWMVPPSYYQATQQNPNDAVPVYRQNAGEGDAGYYDNDGNFVPLQEYPNRNHESDSNGYVEPSQGAIPPHPGYTYSGQSAYAQPQGAAQNYYPPPPGPPPSHDSKRAAFSSSIP